MIIILLALVPLVSSHDDIENSLFISTFYDESKPADVLENSEVQQKWVAVFEDEEIDASSFKRFFIWTEGLQRNVTVNVKSFESTLKVFLSEDPQSNLDELHEKMDISLCNHGVETFTINFQCVSDSTNTAKFEILDGEETYDFEFVKVCKSGVRDDLMIYFGEDLDDEDTVVDEGAVKEEWSDGNKEINGRDVMFSLYIDLGSQLLQKIEIKTELKYKLRGSAVNLHFLMPEQKIMNFLFLEPGSGHIEVILHINPYTPVVFKWYQNVPQTGKINPSTLGIGTAPMINDIASEGKINDQYAPLYVASNVYWTTFYITHKTPMKIGAPKLTTNQHILQPEIIYASKDIGPSPSLFELHYRCINDGRAEVKITIPVKDSTVLEFDVLKVCKKPKIKIQKESSNFSIFMIGGLFSVMAMIAYMLVTKKKLFKLLIS